MGSEVAEGFRGRGAWEKGVWEERVESGTGSRAKRGGARQDSKRIVRSVRVKEEEEKRKRVGMETREEGIGGDRGVRY